MPDRLLARAVVLATGIFVGSPLSAAYAQEVTVPGCFGAATAIVCDVTVEVTSPFAVTTADTTIPVCAGTCVDVPVTVVGVSPTGSGEICVSYTDRSGANQTRTCRTVTAPVLPPAGEVLADLFSDANDVLADALTLARRYEVRGCDSFWESGFVIYDTQTNRNVANFCRELDEIPADCDPLQRPICQ